MYMYTFLLNNGLINMINIPYTIHPQIERITQNSPKSNFGITQFWKSKQDKHTGKNSFQRLSGTMFGFA